MAATSRRGTAVSMRIHGRPSEKGPAASRSPRHRRHPYGVRRARLLAIVQQSWGRSAALGRAPRRPPRGCQPAAGNSYRPCHRDTDGGVGRRRRHGRRQDGEERGQGEAGALVAIGRPGHRGRGARPGGPAPGHRGRARGGRSGWASRRWSGTPTGRRGQEWGLPWSRRRAALQPRGAVASWRSVQPPRRGGRAPRRRCGGPCARCRRPRSRAPRLPQDEGGEHDVSQPHDAGGVGQDERFRPRPTRGRRRARPAGCERAQPPGPQQDPGREPEPVGCSDRRGEENRGRERREEDHSRPAGAATAVGERPWPTRSCTDPRSAPTPRTSHAAARRWRRAGEGRSTA